jgi:tRNA 2-selenouridine synthase SelU
MISKSLHEEISIELELMGKIVHEVASLIEDVSGRPATVRERTAGAFLAQFYGGIENILKRIHRHYNQKKSAPAQTGK